MSVLGKEFLAPDCTWITGTDSNHSRADYPLSAVITAEYGYPKSSTTTSR